MNLEFKLVPEHLAGQKKHKSEHFDDREMKLELEPETDPNNPWTGKYDRRKTVRTSKSTANVPRATFSRKHKPPTHERG